MGQVQFWGDKILFVDGKVAMDEHCCCAFDCPGCWHAPRVLKFVLSNASGCGCLVAGSESRTWSGDPNGTYYLEQCSAGEPCVWQYEGEYGDLTARTYENTGCTGASADVEGKIYGYVEYLDDRYISEWHVRGSGGEFMDAILINVGGGGTATETCDVTDYQINHAYGSNICNEPSGSQEVCRMPSATGDIGVVGWSGGQGLVTAVY